LRASLAAAALLAAGAVIPAAAQEQPPELVLLWGGSGTAEGEFFFSWGVAVGPADNVYAVEAGGNRVQRFSSGGAFEVLWGWGVATGGAQHEICESDCLAAIGGNGAGQLLSARGAAVDSSGRVYVADEQNHRVNVYGSGGAFIEAWGWGVGTGAYSFEKCPSGCRLGIPGGGDGQFSFPHSVEVDRSSDTVYVVDSVNQRVQILTSDGSYLGMIGWGVSGIWLDNPTDVAINSQGAVYIVDLPSHSVLKVAADGSLETSWGGNGTGPGQFDEPHAVAIDSHDSVYVTEFWNHRVQKFDEDGGFLSMWGTQGTGPGQFSTCVEIAVDSRGDIFVTDSTDRIQKFSPTAETRTDDLLDEVLELEVPAGIQRSLIADVERAIEILDSPAIPDQVAERRLAAFIRKVEAQSGRLIPAEEADRLIGWAQDIIDSM
jgi:DNA-binding beta-propeller fold protein YncE